MLSSLLLIAVAIGLLYFGGEVLVSSVSHLALAFSVSPLAIGLTVVAFGTSAPELAASVVAAAAGEPELAVGNVVGSNIANIGLILGISALVAPLAATASFLWREVLYMIGTGALLLPFVLTGALDRWQAVILFALLAAFLWMLTRGGEVSTETDLEMSKRSARWRGIAGAMAGLGLLIFGAKVLVDSAVALARGFGVSTEVIGLSLVAFGTSVPELASCLVAAYRRHDSIILGNVIGSNVFNTLLILPVTLMIRPVDVDIRGIGVSVGIMVVFSLALLLFFARGRRLSRGEGSLLLLGYIAYLAYLATEGSS